MQALVFSLHMTHANAKSLEARAQRRGRLNLAGASAAERGAGAWPTADDMQTLRSLQEQIHQAQGCTHMLSLIISNLWALDSMESADGTPCESLLLPSQAGDAHSSPSSPREEGTRARVRVGGVGAWVAALRLPSVGLASS